MRTVKATLVVAAAVAACACGGTSKRGDPGTTSAIPGGAIPGGGLVVDPTELTFVHVPGNPSPVSRNVYVSWTANDVAFLEAASVDGAKIPSWLSFPQMGSASRNGGSFAVRVNPYNATTGTQSTTLRIGIRRSDGTLVGSVNYPVTLVVKTFGVDQSAIGSTAVFGSSATPLPNTIWVGAGTAPSWTASTDVPWVKLDPPSGPSGNMAVRYDPTGLGVGTHRGTITFAAGTGAVDPLPVTLTVRSPTLTIFPSQLPLAGLGGNDMSPKKVEVFLDTGRNAYPYTVTTDADWIGLAPGVAGASATPAVFTATPTASAQAWAAGTTAAGKLTVTADVNGVPVTGTVDVSYLADDLKLLVSETGIALTKTPGVERLTRVVEVRTNRGLPSSWMATSSQPWLEATRSGSTGAPLVLSVPDTAGLGAGLHEATVTVSSTDTRLVHDTETIRVGVWIGDVTPDPITIVTASYRFVATDPVRPYAYVTNGTATVRALNIYTGEVAGDVTVPGAALARMTVSDDGNRLWVVDEKLPVRRIVPVDLVTHAVGTSWPVQGAATASHLAFARTNGVPLLVTNAGAIFDADSATSVATFPTPQWSVLTASRNGSRFCVLEQGITSPRLECHDLATTSRGKPSVLVGPTKASVGGGPDIMLSPDGTRLFAAPGGLGAITAWDTSLPAHLVSAGYVGTVEKVNAIEVGRDGRIFSGAAAYYDGNGTAFAYDAGGNLLATYSLGAFVEGFLALSGDGRRLVAGIGGYPNTDAVKFVTIPAP